MSAPAAIGFLWENLGPMHLDRCEAVARSLPAGTRVLGIEFQAASHTYEWTSLAAQGFDKVTLFPPGRRRPGVIGRALAIVRAARRARVRHMFFCHYELPEVMLAAWAMRLTGAQVFTMSCAKYDDKPRKAWTEALKSLALLPYHGAISSGHRPRDYMRFLGIDPARIAGEYNTLSVRRMREQAPLPPAPGGTPFAARHFIAVARLVPKKNLAMLLDAFALYRGGAGADRRLVICGSGPLEAELRARAEALGITPHVDFTGFVQTDAVSRYLSAGLALLLPSIEEQFGNVVIEAQALGLPVILGDNCGARDKLVRSGVNGFVVEPDNPQGLAFFMALIAGDEALWTRTAEAAGASAEGGDDGRFVDAVETLIAGPPAR